MPFDVSLSAEHSPDSPHDGNNISFSVLSHALQEGYGISPGFADFLVLGSYILLRQSVLKPLEHLHDVDRHNYIEHDASIVHDDDLNGSELAPIRVDPGLLHKFFKKAYTPPEERSSEDSDVITIEDIAHARVAREADGNAPPDAVHAEIARGEFAMVLNIFGKGSAKTLDAKDLEAWLTENRFPAHWTPTHQETLKDTLSENKKIRELMKAYQGEGPHKILTVIAKSDAAHQMRGVFKAIGKLLPKVENGAQPHGDGGAEVQASRKGMSEATKL